MKLRKKSPLKDEPLRTAGQSIDDHRWQLVQNFILWPMAVWLVFLAMASLEWQQHLFPREPSPWPFTALFLSATIFLLLRSFKVRSRLQHLKQARDGEREVGEFLDELRENGYEVFHDIVGDGFNVDHVLIGPGGVFTLETKTFTKPTQGPANITFDGEQIAIGNWDPDRNPVIQARAQAGGLKSLLQESTGKDFPVTPVIVFPGWFVKSAGRPVRPIWVLNPKALPEYLKHQHAVLGEADVQLAHEHLLHFIRTEEQQRVD